MINKMKSLSLLFLFTFSAELLAADRVITNNISPVNSEKVLTIIGGLLFIIALILVAGWLSRKYMGVAGIGKGVIRIVSGLSLGGKDRIVVVEVGGEQVLLGISPGRISKLHTLSERIEVSNDVIKKPSFIEKLNNEISKRKPND